MTQCFYRLAFACLLIVGCESRPMASDVPRTPSKAITQVETKSTAFGTAITSGIRSHKNQSGFHLLSTGSDAFLTRMAMAESAGKTLDIQYYSTHEDKTGKLLLQAILRAADRGVRVRMLLDDWNLDDFSEGAAALNAHKNIEIRVFNPYVTREQSVFAWVTNAFTDFGQFTRRMHNKALIADNQLAIVGGRNLGDEYFDTSSELNFRDMDILAAGPVVARISNSFDRFWNSDQSFPVASLYLPKADGSDVAELRKKLREHWEEVNASESGNKLRKLPLISALKSRDFLLWAPAELAVDSPDKVEEPVEESKSPPAARLDQLLDHANKEFIAITPYFVPLDNGVAWFGSLIDRGIEVKILTNSLASTDVVPAHSGYSHYRRALIESGVDIYELKPAEPSKRGHVMFGSSASENSLHAKMYVIDRKILVIGSFNLDPISVRYNTELVLVIHNPALAEQVVRIFEQATQPEYSYHVVNKEGKLVWVTKKNGALQELGSDPGAGFKRNAMDMFFSAMPIDHRL